MAPTLTSAQASALLHGLPLNAPVIEVFFNGLYTCLFLATLGTIVMSKRPNKSKLTWSAILILLYVCASIHSAITWETFVLPFHDDGASPDIITALTHQSLAMKVLGLIASALSFLFADLIMIWRCWIVYGRSWLVLVLPILAQIGGTVCAGLGLAGQIAVVLAKNPTAAQALAPLVRFSTPFLSMSLGVTLYTTGLIAWRILRVQRLSAKNGIEREGPGSDLSAALEVLVESSALYAASLFIFVVLLALKSADQEYMQNIHVQIAGIAPTLLIFRISTSRARSEAEWTQSAPRSTLHFASRLGFSTSAHSTSSDGPASSRTRDTTTVNQSQLFPDEPSQSSLNKGRGDK